VSTGLEIAAKSVLIRELQDISRTAAKPVERTMLVVDATAGVHCLP
jgi:signal recognition particle GTPase